MQQTQRNNITTPLDILNAAWDTLALLNFLQHYTTEEVYQRGVAPVPVPVLAAQLADLAIIERTENADGALPYYRTRLTPLGEKLMTQYSLITYELGMMKQYAFTSPGLLPYIKTSPTDYEQLRIGLYEFMRQNLADITSWTARLLARNKVETVLDVGSGPGLILRHILLSEELKDWGNNVRPYLIDRAEGLDHTIEEALGFWGVQFRNIDVLDAPLSDLQRFLRDEDNLQVDAIMVSEFLHCVEADQLPELMSKLHKLLKPGGLLIVIEQHPNLRMDWRLQVTGSQTGAQRRKRSTLHQRHLFSILDPKEYELVDCGSRTTTHWANAFSKEEVTGNVDVD